MIKIFVRAFSLFLILVFVFTGCKDKKDVPKENVENKNVIEKKNEIVSKVDKELEYQSAYNALINYANVLNNPQDENVKKQETVNFMYYTLAPIYDYYVVFDGLTYEQFLEYIEQSAIKNGATESRIKEEIKIRNEKIKEVFDLEKQQISEIVKEIDNKNKYSFNNIEFISETELNSQELDKVNNALSDLVAENAKKLEIFGINTDKYVAQRGYKAKFMINDNEREIIFYFMDGAWRIYTAEIFKQD